VAEPRCDPAHSNLVEPAHERELVALAQAGDDEARRRLIEVFTPVIGRIAWRYARSPTVSREELMQEGALGLLRAIPRYDAGRGTPFWGYASWWVRQAMQQLVAELARPVVLSDRAQRQLVRVKEARRTYAQAHGREPGLSEIAAEAGLAQKQVAKLMAVERHPRTLDEPSRHDGDGGSPLRDLLPDPEAERAFERVPERVDKEQLATLLGTLSERERSIVRSRFGLDGSERTLRELGARFELSAERVRQIEGIALDTLREAIHV
jgi:RNA polymerase sigma factor (sigma-70 family)